jgi:squalene-hopene/tetraprenyl-beta-curcumene cyclase
LPTAHSALGPAIQMLCRKAKNTVALTTIDLCNFLEGVRSAEMSQCRDESALPPDFDVCWDLEFSVDGTTQTARSPRKRIERAVARCIEQLRANQNTDGGWSAISSSNGSLRKSEPDVTGAVLEALKGHPSEDAQSAMNRAACYLRSIQQADGSWADSTGAQDVLCTSAAVRGLLSAGVTPSDDAIAAAVNWLIVQQLPNGSWNFSASQTAWALDALAAAGQADEPAARCSIEFLLESQDDDGGWEDRTFVLYDANSNRWVRNELHSVAWPLLALSRWAVAASSAQSAVAHGLSLRLISATAEI